MDCAFFIPVLTTVLMFRFPKENIKESQRIKLKGIAGLVMLYVLPLVVTINSLHIYTERSHFSITDLFFPIVLELIVSIALFGACSFAVFVMSSFRDRRKY